LNDLEQHNDHQHMVDELLVSFLTRGFLVQLMYVLTASLVLSDTVRMFDEFVMATTELLYIVALQDDCSEAWRSAVITMNSSSNIISSGVNICLLMSSVFSISLDAVAALLVVQMNKQTKIFQMCSDSNDISYCVAADETSQCKLI